MKRHSSYFWLQVQLVGASAKDFFEKKNKERKKESDALLRRCNHTFDDHHARSLVLAVSVARNATVVARIRHLAVGDLHGDHSVREGHCVVVL